MAKADVTPVPEETDAIDEVLDKIEERTEAEEAEQEDEVLEEDSQEYDEPEEDEGEQAEGEADEQQVDEQGPSAAMVAVAKQMGLPDELIAVATSDEKIQQLIDVVQSYGDSTEETEVTEEEVEAFKAALPEDEYGEEDPVRVAFNQLASHFQKQVAEIKSSFSESQKELKALRQAAAEDAQRKQDEFNILFHKSLDSFSNDVLGDSTKKLTEENHTIREAVFNRAVKLMSNGVPGTTDEITARAAKQLFPFLDNSKQKAAQGQRRKSLGMNGNSSPPKHKSSPDARFADSLEEILGKVRR